MAKVTITFEDEGDDSVRFGVEFDPPIKDEDDATTPAQWEACKMLAAMREEHEQEFDTSLDAAKRPKASA